MVQNKLTPSIIKQPIQTWLRHSDVPNLLKFLRSYVDEHVIYAVDVFNTSKIISFANCNDQKSFPSNA